MVWSFLIFYRWNLWKMIKFVVKLPFASRSKKIYRKKRGQAHQQKKWESLGRGSRQTLNYTRGPRWPCITHLITKEVWVNWPFGFQFRRRSEKKKDFQDGPHGSHPGFPIGTILAIFALPVTVMLPTKFEVNWPLRSREEAKNILIFKVSAIFDFQSEWF